MVVRKISAVFDEIVFCLGKWSAVGLPSGVALCGASTEGSAFASEGAFELL